MFTLEALRGRIIVCKVQLYVGYISPWTFKWSRRVWALKHLWYSEVGSDCRALRTYSEVYEGSQLTFGC